MIIADGYLLHPIGNCTGLSKHLTLLCRGYNFYSGIGSDLQEVTLLVMAISGAIVVWKFWRHWKKLHECHLETCHRIAFHPHPVHGHPVCKPHWLELGDDHGLTHPSVVGAAGVPVDRSRTEQSR